MHLLSISFLVLLLKELNFLIYICMSNRDENILLWLWQVDTYMEMESCDGNLQWQVETVMESCDYNLQWQVETVMESCDYNLQWQVEMVMESFFFVVSFP